MQALLVGIPLVVCSCGSSPAVEDVEKVGEAAAPLAVAPGALEGTYLKVLWTYDHNKNLEGLYHDQGIILIETADRELVRLDPLNGLPYSNRLRLQGPLPYPPVAYRPRSTPAGERASDEIYVIQQGDVLSCVEADSMLELWADDLGYGVSCAPCVMSDMIFVAAEGGRINGVRKSDRSVDWIFAAAKTISAPPVLGSRGGVITTPAPAGGEVATAAAVSGADFVYVAAEDGRVYRLHVYSGWKPPGGAGGHSWEGETKAKIVTSPVSYQQKVFVASLDHILYAFEEVDGARAWKYHVGRFVREQPFACRSTVFVLAEESADGPRTLYAVNSTNGKSVWKRDAVSAAGMAYKVDGLPGVGKFLAPGRELVYVLAEKKPEIWGVRIEDGTIVHRIALSARPDFVVSHDAAHGRDADATGLILMGSRDGRIVALKERRVYAR
jgi:outer membrane protein assembly factor BamB